MFKEIGEILWEGIKRVVKSRLFVVSVIFIILFAVLVIRLFNLQIVSGENYQDNYVQKTEKTVSISGTRGNIYDRNGTPLAYNELAYAVTYTDSGYYENGYQRNKMLLSLIALLDEHEETIVSSLPMSIDDRGAVQYTTSSDADKNRFLRDVYGLTSVDELDDKNGNYPSNVSAQYIFDLLKERYGIGVNEDKTEYDIDNVTALKLMNIRYSMAQNAYRKYEAVTIASDISMDTVASIKEHESEFHDIDVSEETIRVYNDSYAFAHILGYTGQADDEELEELQEADDTYELGDVIGKAGIEASFELELSGEKGSETMYVDSEGRILEVTDTEEPSTGNDIYLSIDRDLQVGIYSLIEQNLAGILVSRLTNDPDYDPSESDGSSKLIPATTAYFQLINNNVLSMSHFYSDDASELERSIYSRFSEQKDSVISQLKNELLNENAQAFDKLDQYMQDYQDYVYDYMRTEGYVLESEIDSADETYLAWVNETISFYEFLYYAIEQGWIDTELIDFDTKYASTSDTYEAVVDTIVNIMDDDPGFHKLIYKYLIENGRITGCEMCLCLFEQDVIAYDEASYSALKAGSENTAFSFLKQKIQNLELTPAQMALEPCSASCVVTDPDTGEVLALVTYPGYDINKFSGSIDADYYAQLYNDLSLPFLSRATQVETAPGSIFKLVTTSIGLEEGLITTTELIDDTGTYDKQGMNLKCWNVYGHGELNVVGAIAQSCNYFFSEVGYRASLDSRGEYDGELGISVIQKYAEKFGLGEKSGIEIAESEPHISDEGPIASAIGQGTNTFACIHLSRYITTIASRGNLYTYTLVSKIESSDGDILSEYTSTVEDHVNFSNTTWETLKEGMIAVMGENPEIEGSLSGVFDSPLLTEVGIAGKSGTAEQADMANHATFIAYGPVFDSSLPDVAMAVSIPNGYGSSNAATLAVDIFEYYYGYTDLSSILENNNAADMNSTVIAD